MFLALLTDFGYSIGPPPQLTDKKRPRSYKVGMRYNAPQLVEVAPIHNTDLLKGKMVKVKRRRLKGKRHTQDIIRVPAAHDVITRHEVNPYNDVSTLFYNPIQHTGSHHELPPVPCGDEQSRGHEIFENFA